MRHSLRCTVPIHPPIQHAGKYPFTTFVAVAAVLVSLNWWFGGRWVDPFFMHYPLGSRPWTLLTSALPHVGPVHLLFNLAWWWPFGASVERVWGTPKAVAIFAVLAALSSAAEFAVFEGGVGLSGVVYGMCSLIWVVQSEVAGFDKVVTRRTLQLFAGWFVLCIVLTVTNVMPIANVAHGVGAFAGWILGKCIVDRHRRIAWSLALAGLTAAIGMCATVLLPYTNFSPQFRDPQYRGTRALTSGNYSEAVRLLEIAVKDNPFEPGLLRNLGIAYMQLGRNREAMHCFIRCTELDPSEREGVAPSIGYILDLESQAAVDRGDPRAATKFAEESLRWMPDGEYAASVITYTNSLAEWPVGETVEVDRLPPVPLNSDK